MLRGPHFKRGQRNGPPGGPPEAPYLRVYFGSASDKWRIDFRSLNIQQPYTLYIYQRWEGRGDAPKRTRVKREGKYSRTKDDNED